MITRSILRALRDESDIRSVPDSFLLQPNLLTVGRREGLALIDRFNLGRIGETLIENPKEHGRDMIPFPLALDLILVSFPFRLSHLVVYPPL